MTDEERLIKLQQDVLGNTKAAIQLNAPGIPLAFLGKYLQKIGGILMVVDDEMDIQKFPDPNPFRLCVTTKMRPNFENATQTEVVDKVKGWG